MLTSHIISVITVWKCIVLSRYCKLYIEIPNRPIEPLEQGWGTFLIWRATSVFITCFGVTGSHNIFNLCVTFWIGLNVTSSSICNLFRIFGDFFFSQPNDLASSGRIKGFAVLDVPHPCIRVTASLNTGVGLGVDNVGLNSAQAFLRSGPSWV